MKTEHMFYFTNEMSALLSTKICVCLSRGLYLFPLCEQDKADNTHVDGIDLARRARSVNGRLATMVIFPLPYGV